MLFDHYDESIFKTSKYKINIFTVGSNFVIANSLIASKWKWKLENMKLNHVAFADI